MNLQGWRYFVVGRDKLVEELMVSACAYKSKGLKDADIVIFTGGVDVNPMYYNEKACPETQVPDVTRDRTETAIYRTSRRNKKHMVGICRGAQLLNVLNGGRLWQHHDGHTNTVHPCIYFNERSEKFVVPVTSDHHQMMAPTSDGAIWGTAGGSTFKKSDDRYLTMPEKHILDPEIVYYRATKSLCFQPHPEWGLVSCKNLFIDCVYRMMT